MKKALLRVISVMLTFVMLSLAVSSNFSAVENESKPDENKVLETRFVNMLNHSFVYNEDFSDVEAIVNNSVVALLESRAGDYISNEVLNGYLYDMFGFEVYDFSDINKDFPQKEGYVYILPRGFTIYNHTANGLSVNDDGTYTFTTKLVMSYHDSVAEAFDCETVFVKNENSAFGFNIVRSEIKFEELAV